MKDKLYIIKKYVKAKSAAQAIRKEKTVQVDDCWIDDEWRKGEKDNLAAAIGFGS
jgi:hypothetical protein